MARLKHPFWIALAGIVASALSGSGALAVEPGSVEKPVPVEGLVYARAFALSQGYRWPAAHAGADAKVGVIVVLRVDPALVVPRNGPGPILYAGDRMLQALNHGHTSGHVIGLVPGVTDLSTTPFWFGPFLAPGRADAESLRAKRAQADEAGIRPFTPEEIKRVLKPAVVARDLDALLRGELAELVLEFAPGEGDLARKWRLPVAEAKPDSTAPRPVPAPVEKRESK